MLFKRCIICKKNKKSSLYKSHYEVCRLQNIIELEQILDDADHPPTSVNESCDAVENESSENTEERSGCKNKSETEKNESSESESIEDTNEASSSKKNVTPPDLVGKF